MEGLITRLQKTSKDQIRNMHFELANDAVSLRIALTVHGLLQKERND